MARKERRSRAIASLSHAAWSFPGLLDRMLFARSSVDELAPSGVQKVVRMPVENTAKALEEVALADLQRQAAVIGVHQAWF